MTEFKSSFLGWLLGLIATAVALGWPTFAISARGSREICAQGSEKVSQAVATWLTDLHAKDADRRTTAAAALARCGDPATRAVISALDQSLAREGKPGEPDNQSDVTDALAWVLTNAVGLPDEDLISWMTETVPGLAAASPIKERLIIVSSILGDRHSLSADRIVTLLSSSNLLMRRLGVALAPATSPVAVYRALQSLGDKENDPDLRQDARLAAIALGGTDHAPDWIDHEAVEANRQALTRRAALALPLPFLIDRARSGRNLAIRSEAIDALAQRRTLPGIAIAPLLIDLADPALKNISERVLLALKRVDSKAPEWSSNLECIWGLVQDADKGRHASGLLLLVYLGRSADPLHNRLKALSATVEDAGNGQLDAAIIATAPGDADQARLAQAALERSKDSGAFRPYCVRRQHQWHRFEVVN